MISREKEQELKSRMLKLNILEEDLKETFILGSGAGGQKVNKTASCVYIKHLPTGLEVKCQKERSRNLNRFFARRLLCEKIEAITLKEKSKKQQEIEKIKRQKRKRSKRAQEKMLDDKKTHSEKKELRSKLRGE
jgi:protein subunit release factor B